MEQNLHKTGATLQRTKEPTRDRTSARSEIAAGGRIVRPSRRREPDESASEDRSAHRSKGDPVTKTHHLDRVKTSEVTMAMHPFVCLPVFLSLRLYSAATLSAPG